MSPCRHYVGIDIAAQVYCNMGGPMSRTRTQALRASLLAGGGSPFDCCARAGIDFGKRDPLATVERALRAARIRDPEELRATCPLPAEACLCREQPSLQVPRAADLSPTELLGRAVLLGLCTSHHYDPRRPVLFTRASLARRLELYCSQGYYA
jgi:hypothetical protein